MFSDDVEQIRKALDIPKICVLGHSIHGNLALEYARKYPQHTSHVIVIGAPPNGMRKNLKALLKNNRTLNFYNNRYLRLFRK